MKEKPFHESSNPTAYVTGKLNTEGFTFKKRRLDEYFKSTRYFFTKDYLSEGNTFLDVGGAGGNLADAIHTEIANIVPTIIDPDLRSIEKGRENFPEFEFIHGYFPQALPAERTFDVVSIQALFPQIPNWKEMLLALSRCSKRYLNISLTFKLQGTTVVDKDVSYCYYLDSGERIHQVVHNIYEFINFCCIYEMGVKKINFYGYHTPTTGDNFRCVPNSEQIKGNIMLEFFSSPEENPVRWGAFSHDPEQPGYHCFVPEMDILIDDKVFNVREN